MSEILIHIRVMIIRLEEELKLLKTLCKETQNEIKPSFLGGNNKKHFN